MYRPPPRRRYTPVEISSQASRMAATPCPPAAQIEIRPRTGLPVSFFFSASCLASCATIRPPVAANGWPAASDEPLTLSLDRSMRPECGVQAQPLLAVLLGLPRRQRGQHHRRERLVDLVEVEVLQAQAVSGQQPRHRVRRRHQQAVLAVHVVHRRGLAVDEVGQHRDARAPRPTRRWPAAPPTHRRSAASSCPPSSSRRRSHPEHRLELGQLLRPTNRRAGCCPGTPRGTG